MIYTQSNIIFLIIINVLKIKSHQSIKLLAKSQPCSVQLIGPQWGQNGIEPKSNSQYNR